MDRVALITRDFTLLNKGWTQVLTNLGIEFVLCRATDGIASAQIETPAGRFAANSNDLRGFFRQFKAVIITDHETNLAWSSMTNYAFHWLGWNDPDDPAFLFFNPHFPVAVTSPAFPSDFPIIRPDANDLAGTVVPADGGTPSANPPVESFGNRARSAKVQFLHENITAYLPTLCNTHTNNIPYLWRLDMLAHMMLASTSYTHRVARDGYAGEIIAKPVSEPDVNFLPDTVIAYRYKNCFWLPHAFMRTRRAVNLWDMGIEQNCFWLLYGLKLAGVQPKHPIPIHSETDHPIQYYTSYAPFAIDTQQFMRSIYATYDYWRSFCKRTGTVVIHGVNIGGRHRGGTTGRNHWNSLYSPALPIEAREAAQQVNALMIETHKEGSMVCSVHDHTLMGAQGGYWMSQLHTNFVRHSGMQYGAPNDVPIQRGNYCVHPNVLPQGVAGSDAIHNTIGSETMVEWDLLKSGTGTTFDLPLESVHAARIIVESEIEEMLALGFPDGYCGGHKYTNTAANSSGGECYWQALSEMGFRGVRSAHACNEAQATKRVAPNRMWHGFHLVNALAIDMSSSGAGYSRGLYHPAAPSGGDAVRYYQLDFGSDISTNWSTDPSLAWRAYRRVVGQMTGNWLSTACISLGATYTHPPSFLMMMNLSNPVARFDGWNLLNTANQPHYNHIVEVNENMDAIVRLVPGFLKWGNITDIMDLREKVMGY